MYVPKSKMVRYKEKANRKKVVDEVASATTTNAYGVWMRGFHSPSKERFVASLAIK